MKTFNSLGKINILETTSVALGNFDGLHVGHRKIMEDAIDSAKKVGLKPLCFTFSNHPANYIMGRDDNDPDAVKLICSEDDKVRLIEEMGFDILVNVPFDENIMTMDASDFFADIIVDKLNAGCVSCGFNYSYGARASGNPDTLKEECERAGIGCNIHDAVKVDGNIVSSTLIRETISKGDMELAARYLGRPLSFYGKVQHGEKIGSVNGYPTANINVDENRILPPHGVYFSKIILDSIEFRSISNIGIKPTIHEDLPTTIETYIFDYDGNLYGKEVLIEFMHFARPEVRFDSRDELFSQISNDVEQAEKFFQKI